MNHAVVSDGSRKWYNKNLESVWLSWEEQQLIPQIYRTPSQASSDF